MNNPFRIYERELFFGNGDIVFIHNSKKSLSSAYEVYENASIKIKIPRVISPLSVNMELVGGQHPQRAYSIAFEWINTELGYDLYYAKLPLRSLGTGIYFFRLHLDTFFGDVFGEKKNGELCFSRKKPDVSFQITVSDFKYKPPKDLNSLHNRGC